MSKQKENYESEKKIKRPRHKDINIQSQRAASKNFLQITQSIEQVFVLNREDVSDRPVTRGIFLQD